MNSSSKTIDSRIQRCAVSKIDLKGRFVYIDDESAHLFDSTKEDLFGHFFIDYVADADKEIIEAIVNFRNHYESFYDAARISIKTAKGKFKKVDIIASLNFIAGNPVNFQFIIYSNSEQQVNLTDNSNKNKNSVEYDFIEKLNNLDHEFKKGDYLSLAESLKQLTGIEQVGIYKYNKDSLKPAYDFSSVNLKKLPNLERIHTLVAAEKSKFSSLDDNDVRWAIELTKHAPNEFIFSVLDGQQSILFRIILPDMNDDKKIKRIVSTCKICYSILNQHSSKESEQKKVISEKNTLKEFDTLKLSLDIQNGNIKIEEHKDKKRYIITCPSDSKV